MGGGSQIFKLLERGWLSLKLHIRGGYFANTVWKQGGGVITCFYLIIGPTKNELLQIAFYRPRPPLLYDQCTVKYFHIANTNDGEE